MIFKYKPVLVEVAIQVLQELAFIFAEPCEPQETFTNVSFSKGAVVGFSGPLSGKIVVIAEENLLGEITANMLGIDTAQVTAGEQKDALGEVANVICGNLLPRLCGKDATLTVYPPKTFREDKIGQDDNNAVIVTLSADEGLCKVILKVENLGNLGL